MSTADNFGFVQTQTTFGLTFGEGGARNKLGIV